MNPFYEQFKVTHFSGEGLPSEEELGPVYKGILFQRGYGIGCNNLDAYEKYGLGFGDVMSRVFQFAVPFLKQGLQYLGKKAVNTVSDIAQDAILGKNVPESAQKHISSAAGEIFGKITPTLKRAQQDLNEDRDGEQDSLSPPPKRVALAKGKRRRSNQKFGRKLVRSYPILGKI